MTERDFEPIGGTELYDGKIFTVRAECFRFREDGTEVEREVVRSPGAVAIVAIDEEHLWLVRQPREVVGDPDSLELPAGRLDVEGEPPLEAAKRELAEEIGKVSDHWRHLKTYHSSSGFTDEQVHLYLASEVRDAEGEHDSGEDERIEIVPWPLSDLDGLVARSADAKTIMGALMLARERTG